MANDPYHLETSRIVYTNYKKTIGYKILFNNKLFLKNVGKKKLSRRQAQNLVKLLNATAPLRELT